VIREKKNDSKSKVEGRIYEKIHVGYLKYETMETSDRNNKRGRSEINDAIRVLEGAGYKVTPPQHSDRGRGGRRDSQKATVQVWGR